jgi:hypothetical protein
LNKIILIIVLCFFSCKEETITVETKLRITGNDPFTELSFTRDGKEVKLNASFFDKYKDLAYKNVRITGKIKKVNLESPDGKIKREYYELSPDTIIVLE